MSMKRFMDIQEDILKGQKEILDSMDKVNKSTDKFNTGLKESSEKIKFSKEKFSDINKDLEKQNKFLTATKGLLKEIADIAVNIGKAFAAIFSISSIINTVKSIFGLRQQMVDLSFQMNLGKDSARELTKQITTLSMETGYAADKVATMYKELAESKVPFESLRELTEASLRFSEATGVNEATTTRLTAELTRMGRLGTKEVTGLLAGMLKAQRSFGISASNMERLSDAVIESTRRLSQMGKGSEFIARFTSGTTKLAGAFASVGLEAGEAANIVQRLLDPGQLENNALLISKLGLSMSDVIQGDMDPSMLVSRFKDLGDELKNMSGPAASALASQMGMSLFDLRQMAEMDESAIAEKFNLASDGLGELREATSEQDDFARRWEKTMESVKSSVMVAVDALLPTFTQLTDFFSKNISADKIKGFIERFTEFAKSIPEKLAGIKKFAPILIAAGAIAIALFVRSFIKRFQGVGPEVAKSISEGVQGGMEMGFEKSKLKVRESLNDVFKNVSEDFQRRTKESADYALKQSRVAFYGQMAQQTGGFTSSIFSAAEAMASGTGSYVKRVSLIEELTKKIRGNIEETAKANIDNFQALQQTSGNYSVTLDEEIQKLEKISGIEGVNTAFITRRINDLKKEKEQVDAIGKNYEQAAERANDIFLKRASKETLEGMYQESALLTNSLEEQINAYIEKDLYIKKEQIAAKNILEGTQGRIEQLQKLGDLSVDQQQELGRLQKDELVLQRQIADLNKESNDSVDKMNELREQANKELEKQVRLEKEINNKQASDTKGAGTLGAKVGNLLRSVGDSVGSKFSEMGNNLKAAWGNFKATLPNLGKMFGNAVASFAKGTAKVVAGLGAGLLTAVMALGPIQDIMAELKVPITELVESVGKALMPAIRSMMPVIRVLVDRLLMPLVRVLLPPMINLLGMLIQAIGGLVGGMAKFASVFSKDVSTDLQELSDTLTEAGDSMRDASEVMRADFAAMGGLERSLRELGITINRSANVEEALSKVRENLSNTESMSNEQLREALMVNASALWKSINDQEIAKAAEALGTGESAELIRSISDPRGGHLRIQQGASALAEKTGISSEEMLSMLSRARTQGGGTPEGISAQLVQMIASSKASEQFRGLTGFSNIDDYSSFNSRASRSQMNGITSTLLGEQQNQEGAATPSQGSPSAAIFGVSDTGEYLELREAAKSALSAEEMQQEMLALQRRSAQVQEELLKAQQDANTLKEQELEMIAQENLRREAIGRVSQ